MSNLEQTLSIIKPDAVERNLSEEIKEEFKKNGFKILKEKKVKIEKSDAEKFYEVHCERPFYGELVSFMSRGPIVAAILEKENAVEEFRKLIGSTNPAEAEEGTIRNLYATSMGENAVHGSDSDENAEIEGNFHFSSNYGSFASHLLPIQIRLSFCFELS